MAPERQDAHLEGTGRFSVAVPRRWWYPACPADELGSAPLAFEFAGTPLMAFRGPGGVPAVLVDRCPHRNVPLHLGRVRADGLLECGYHGWCFDGAGTCRDVPGLDAEPDAATRAATSHACAESDGFVWFWGEAGAEPSSPPPTFPDLSDTGGRATRVGRTVFARDLDATVHAAVENALDVPHTAFLHGGIFRGNKVPREITAVRRDLHGPDGARGVEVQYIGEPIGFGPLTLSADQTDRTFDHWDRFLLPSTAQVEYRIDGWIRIVNTILHLPLDDFRTRAWFVLDHATPIPTSITSPIIKWRGQAILEQDVDMLAAQTASTRRFGGERYTSTDLDLFGNAIWRLLRGAERAETGDATSDASDDTATETGTDTGTEVTLRL